MTLWERKKIFETKVLQPLLALIDDPNNPEVAAEGNHIMFIYYVNYSCIEDQHHHYDSYILHGTKNN